MRKGTSVVCLEKSKAIQGLPELSEIGVLKGGYIIPEPEPPEMVQVKLQKKTVIETIKFYLDK
nr:MAG TPA_asm: hypothetical protein [Caudoviricetes sp.]